ncbi:MAG TPA: metalloregulator ArsR/SmtB family transcription factor [Geminicoccus sp.]|jgi:DNA-binding transcriptional ArsR family regulator|uniref:ArsR/SmtB family transcription factor n=1 Tax=Geminicoccus sp. TaxID=2024832 RepID=UPI002E359D31|nr:metalloregulator ArsR/SmtB family transcription factor [Geminicoccus sp.]HEX2526280.1 metalloregulator ArsR/SmtB family transcription factor [Geminicoccus sp.]
MNSLTALADPTRRQIVELLSQGERAAGEITERFALSAPAISQHLKVLREAGLVVMRVEGQRRIYRLDPEGLREIDGWLGKVRRFWSESLDGLERGLREAAAKDQQRKTS